MSKKPDKLSLKQFVWLAFNYVASPSFFTAIAIYINAKTNKGQGLGFWVFLVIFLTGLVAFVVARAFGKLALKHKLSQNGAAYVFTRTNLGRGTGLFIGFVQYCYIPFTLTNNAVSIIKGLFTEQFVGSMPTNIYLGSFTDLYLDLIAIGIFILAVILVRKGIKWYRRISDGANIIRWVSFFLIIILSVAMAIAPSLSKGTNGSVNVKFWFQNSHITLGAVIGCFNAALFLFVGCELLATAGENIENAEKTISRGFVIVIVISLAYYLSMLFVFMVGTSNFSENYNMGIWSGLYAAFNKVPQKVLDALFWSGVIITVVGYIGARFFTIMSKGLFGATTLQPLAYEGFFPDKIGRLDKNLIPSNACWMHMCISCLFMLGWMIIPDIIKGAKICSVDGFYPTLQQYDANGGNTAIISLSALSSFSAIIAIVIYITTLIVSVKLTINKKINCGIVDLIIFIIVILFLFLVFVYHYYDLINGTINEIKTNAKPDVLAPNGTAQWNQTTKAIIEFATTLAIGLFFVVWFNSYYRTKINNRPASVQTKLDREFVLQN